MNFSSWSFLLLEQKKQWLIENPEGYQILYLRFSRIWPGYIISYNVQNFNFEKNCLDYKIHDNAPNEKWLEIQKHIVKVLDISGLQQFSDQELWREVPFVMDETWPDTEDDESEPILVPVNMYRCLFEK